MKTYAATLAVLVLVAMQAGANPAQVGIATGIVTSHQLPPPPLDLMFELRTLSGDKVSLKIEDIVTATNQQWKITESNAANYGVDWSAWEAVINTRQTQGKLFGTLTFGDYVDDRGAGDPLCCGFVGHFDLSEIDLEVGLNAQNRPGWFFATAIANGNDDFVVPEPQSIMLLLLSCSFLMVFRRKWRAEQK